LLAVTADGQKFSTIWIGFIMSGFFVGFACGIFVSGRLIRRMGHIRTFAFCAALCATIALLRVIWMNPWVWLLLRFCYGIAFVTLMTVTESWLNTRVAKEERGRFSDTHDRRKVLICVSALAAVMCLIMPLAQSQKMLMITFFVWGGLSFSLCPLGVAQLLDQLHPDEVVSGSTDMLVLNGAGSALAPLFAGIIMNLVGTQGMPLYMAGILFLLTGYAVYQVRHVSVLTAGEHAHFEPMMQTSHEIVGMIEKEG
jgi:MFS family permease